MDRPGKIAYTIMWVVIVTGLFILGSILTAFLMTFLFFRL